jgi:uncharacterized damage-inducible protein DinB
MGGILMEFNNFEYLKEFSVRYNNTTKEEWFTAFLEATEKITQLEEENAGLEQGFEYWETQYKQLKQGVLSFINSDQETEDFKNLNELIK